ncbi:hypothetical protein [Chitinophaga sp.]|uniref:hypothetical protein n=1 Tax=Chitinophaga sp. TaxID=1869181 RepID=UPI0031D1F02A
MKRIKILLSSVVVIAIVSVALASHSRMHFKVYSWDPASQTCTVFVRDFAVINVSPTATSLLTTDPTQPCLKADIVPLVNN